MRCSLALTLLILLSCSEPQSEVERRREIDALKAELKATQARADAAEREAKQILHSPQSTPSSKPKKEAVAEVARQPQAEEPADLCFQDYCPCAPPQGGPDAGLCRQLRAGLSVEDDVMSAAAMMRDARKQMDEFEAENGPL
jgi:hypothetical protein